MEGINFEKVMESARAAETVRAGGSGPFIGPPGRCHSGGVVVAGLGDFTFLRRLTLPKETALEVQDVQENIGGL